MNYLETAKKIIEKIEKFSGKAYIVGGFSRDKIMGLNSNTDIDIATNLTPEKLKKIFKVVDIKGEKFGVLVIKENNFIFEVTSFRKEIYVNNKLEKIKFPSSFEEDARRRDFTINAIYYNPIKEEFFSFNDYDGINDAKNKIIRFIGNPEDRIKEDPLRLLRYVRFKYNFGLKDFDTKQYEIVKKNFFLLKDIPFERIKIELEKVFENKNTTKALKELKDLGFFKIFIPEIDNLEKIPGGPPYHLEGNVWEHTLLIIENLEKLGIKKAKFYWMALFHDVGKAETYRIKENGNISYIGHEEKSSIIFEKYKHSLRFKKEEYKEIKWIIEKHLLYGKFLEMRPLKQAKMFLNKNFLDFLDFCYCDKLASIGKEKEEEKKNYYNKILEKYKNFKEIYDKTKFFTGKDILKKYPNLKGKEIGERLESLNNKKILGIIKSLRD